MLSIQISSTNLSFNYGLKICNEKPILKSPCIAGTLFSGNGDYCFKTLGV
jgi:hypothetical protein